MGIAIDNTNLKEICNGVCEAPQFDLAAYMRADEVAVAVGESFKVMTTLKNVHHTNDTWGTLKIIIAKSTQGTHTLDPLPAGWSVIQDMAVFWELHYTPVIPAATDAPDDIVFTYQHDGTVETSIKNFSVVVGAETGGPDAETDLTNNTADCAVQVG